MCPHTQHLHAGTLPHVHTLQLPPTAAWIQKLIAGTVLWVGCVRNRKRWPRPPAAPQSRQGPGPRPPSLTLTLHSSWKACSFSARVERAPQSGLAGPWMAGACALRLGIRASGVPQAHRACHSQAQAAPWPQAPPLASWHWPSPCMGLPRAQLPHLEQTEGT